MRDRDTRCCCATRAVGWDWLLRDQSGWVGLLIFNTTQAGAEEIYQKDPAVTACVFEFETHPIIGIPGMCLPE